jgi:exopolyphosphatase/guanosine-5'-triphosphate,3'-diphosphate pyrophosphatase
VENLSKSPALEIFSNEFRKADVRQVAIGPAPGRLEVGEPLAIVDVGSNSVRLVAYEGLTRAPTPIFNEKVLCALGREVVTTGRLDQAGMERAIGALKRFRVLCAGMGIRDIRVLATAAVREALNGPEFLAAARAAIGYDVALLSGQREARLAALGVVSSVHGPDGVVGDLGGGSLELVDIAGERVGEGISLQLGGLALMDVSGRSLKKAAKIVRDMLASARILDALKGRSFYAVGGTWRALARLHMIQVGYPLHVMHGYSMPARDAAAFANLFDEDERKSPIGIASINPARRPVLAYGALLLEQIIARGKPRDVVISALGVREGYLYEQLDPETRSQDPLLCAARALNLLRSRAPRHGDDLCDWTDELLQTSDIAETADERRLRHAACLLADTSWRAHPDYRAEQSLNVIMHSVLIGVDHPGLAFLALCAAYRHLLQDDVSPAVRAMLPPQMAERARVIGAAMRVAYIVSAAMPGILPRTTLTCSRNKLVLTLPRALADLASERLQNRLRQLARLMDRQPAIAIAEDELRGVRIPVL